MIAQLEYERIILKKCMVYIYFSKLTSAGFRHTKISRDRWRDTHIETEVKHNVKVKKQMGVVSDVCKEMGACFGDKNSEEVIKCEHFAYRNKAEFTMIHFENNNGGVIMIKVKLLSKH